MGTTLQFNTKAQLVQALEERRPWAIAYDEYQAREHRAKEDEALKKFRDRCRRFGRLNLVTLKTTVENADSDELTVRLPECPMSALTQLDDALEALALTRQEKFTLDGTYRDRIYRAYWLLTTASEDRPKRSRTVCA